MSANETTLHPSHNVLKVNNYRSKYGHQHGALAHTEQQAIKAPAKKTILNHSNRKTNGLILIKNEKHMNHTNKRQPLNNRLMT